MQECYFQESCRSLNCTNGTKSSNASHMIQQITKNGMLASLQQFYDKKVGF